MPKAVCCLYLLVFSGLTDAAAQSLGGAGTLRGNVRDPANAPVPSAIVDLSNPVTSSSLQTRTALDGTFVINNIPPNIYNLRVSVDGFQPYSANIAIRTGVPLDVNVRVELASQ